MNTKRFWSGFGWGVLATVGMSIPMIIGTATGVAPMPYRTSFRLPQGN